MVSMAWFVASQKSFERWVADSNPPEGAFAIPGFERPPAKLAALAGLWILRSHARVDRRVATVSYGKKEGFSGSAQWRKDADG
jgi:hypothetical protein